MYPNYSSSWFSEAKLSRLKSLNIRLKAVEVVLSSLCLGLGLDAFMNGAVPQWPGVGLCCILTGAYLLITGVTMGCTLLACPLPKPLSVSLSALGGLLFACTAVSVLRGTGLAAERAGAAAAAGASYATYATGLRQMKAQGTLALAAAAAFIVDAAHEAVVGPWLRGNATANRLFLPRRPAPPLPALASAPAPVPASASPAYPPPPSPSAPPPRPPPPPDFSSYLGRALSSVSQRLPPVSAAAAAARRFQRSSFSKHLSASSRYNPTETSLYGREVYPSVSERSSAGLLGVSRREGPSEAAQGMPASRSGLGLPAVASLQRAARLPSAAPPPPPASSHSSRVLHRPLLTGSAVRFAGAAARQ